MTKQPSSGLLLSGELRREATISILEIVRPQGPRRITQHLFDFEATA